MPIWRGNGRYRAGHQRVAMRRLVQPLADDRARETTLWGKFREHDLLAVGPPPRNMKRNSLGRYSGLRPFVDVEHPQLAATRWGLHSNQNLLPVRRKLEAVVTCRRERQ